MTIIFLQNIFEKSINGEWGNEDSGKGEATAVIRTSNFLNSGRLNLDNIVCREIDKDKNSDKILRTGDIIIEKSGGSPNQPVGRVVYFDVTDQDYFTNNFTSILRVKPEYNSKYIFYLMKYLYDTKKVLKFQNQTTGIINLKLADYLNKTKVNIETIENQNTIVDILDRLEYQIINRNKQISELSNLVKSRFNEMFGDPILNDMGWEVTKLGVLTNKISSGNTPKGGSQVYVDRGIMFFRSQNVWKNKILLDDIAYIDDQTNRNMKDTILEHGDLLITKTGRVNTENSSLGRTAQYLGQSGKANINGHVYLVRINSDISKRFILEILISDAYRDYIRRICVGGIDKRQLNKNHIEDFPI
ncbi:conserved domain protein, partial [Streptococcus mitis bv. 2 str. SK95]